MSAAQASTQRMGQQQRRGFWLRTIHQWHWISSAVCLIGMLLFTITGITLNHANQIEGEARREHRVVSLPEPLLGTLRTAPDASNAPLPARVADWLTAQSGLSIAERDAEWSEEDIYLSLPGPGSDAWLSIDLATGDVEYERTDRGWISYFNDLHKGRNTGAAWRWFIDVFAVACLVFCVTGLFLLQLHARQRRMTWPYVGLGLIVPLILALIFIH